MVAYDERSLRELGLGPSAGPAKVMAIGATLLAVPGIPAGVYFAVISLLWASPVGALVLGWGVWLLWGYWRLLHGKRPGVGPAAFWLASAGYNLGGLALVVAVLLKSGGLLALLLVAWLAVASAASFAGLWGELEVRPTLRS